MLRILRFIFTGSWHEHKWVTRDTRNIKRRADNTVSGTVYVCRCEICGKIRDYQMRVY